MSCWSGAAVVGAVGSSTLVAVVLSTMDDAGVEGAWDRLSVLLVALLLETGEAESVT